jgi:hypothetical protein
VIYLFQLAGLCGLFYAVRGRPTDLAMFGRAVALGALVMSLLFWGDW